MDKYFRTEQGEVIDVIQHTLDQLKTHPDTKIYIGTDSQDKSKSRRRDYATAVVYRYGTNGAHYVYRMETTPKIREVYDHLFREAVLTIEAAQMFDECSIKVEALEFDYNHVKKFKSNPLIQAVKGWVTGLGHTPVFKSGQMIATKAADHIVRNK